MTHHRAHESTAETGELIPEMITPVGGEKLSDGTLQPHTLTDDGRLRVDATVSGPVTVGSVDQGAAGTDPWLVAIDQTGTNNDVDVISTVLPPNAAQETGGNLDAIKADLDAILANQTDGDQIVSTKTPLTPSAPTFATVGVVSALALAANASRKGLHLVNTSASTISIAFGAPAIIGNGISLNANGGSFWMDEYCFTTDVVNAIASGAGSNLAIQEFTT